MGKKIRAAKASLVAAFLAAGGSAAAKATPAVAAAHTPSAVGAASPLRHYNKAVLSWGDPLIRFIKLDGFPAYVKVDDFAALTNYYKLALLSDAATLYQAWPGKVQSLLDLYQKADGGPLSGILIGLDQYLKYDNPAPLSDYVKTDAGLNAYIKFFDFYDALQQVARSDESGKGMTALNYFIKLTGFSYLPAVQDLLGDNGGGVKPE